MHIKMHDKCRFVKGTAATVQITLRISGAPRGATLALFSKRRDARVRPLHALVSQHVAQCVSKEFHSPVPSPIAA
jgi:hypothetical protein